MAKRRRQKKVSEGTITAEEFYTAFIDTSLGTHLAVIISSFDTVFDLKKKIVLEHSQLFPRTGEIKVISLQVKRQGHFYHLPDSMLVFSAYEGSKHHKFLYVDASSSEEHDREQLSCEPDTIGHIPLLQVHDENVHLGSLDSVALQTDRNGHKEIELNHDHEVLPSEMCKPSDEGNADVTNKASFLMPKLIVTSVPMEILTSDGRKRNKKKRARKKVSALQTDSVSKQTNMAGVNSSDGPNLNVDDYSSDKTYKKENMVPLAETDRTTEVEEERALSANLDPQGKTSECFKPADRDECKMPIREAVHSSDLLHSNEAIYVGNSTGKKRKKQRTKDSAAKVQGISEIEHDLSTVNDISLSVQDIAFSNQMTDYDNKSENNVPCTETNQTTSGGERLSMEQGTKVTSPTGSKPLNLGDINSNIIESATAPMLSKAKDVKSVSRRKERRTAKSSVINQDGSELELVNTLNGLSALNDSPANNVADETKNARGIQSENVWKDASKHESMDACVSGAHKEGNKFTHNEAGHLPSTEIDQSQEDGGDMGENGTEVLKNNRNSIDNANYDLLVEGETNEAQGLQLNQSDKLRNNDCNVDKKAKKKKKKNQISAAEILSSSEINKQNIVTSELAASGDKTKGMDSPSGAPMTSALAKRTVIQSTASDLELEKNAGTECNASNPEHARKDANPSQVPFKERPKTEIDNGNNIETAKGEDEGINFRHYFVPAQHQDKIASSVKVKEKSQSTKPKRKNGKHNVVAETKLESSDNHGNQNESDDKNVDKNLVEESASGDEHNKILLRGNKKISKASEDGVNASGFHEVEGDKTLERAVQEKNLLTTPRANFREDSSESSSDENKMVNSDASTHTPSDGSSSSGYSVGKSELSQDSKRNGSVNATRKGGGAGSDRIC